MTASKVALVTGASGLLGREIVDAFERKGWKVVGTALTRPDPPRIIQLDVRDEKAVAKVLDEVKPSVIVHSAANRSPDKVATDPSAGLDINVRATGTLVKEACSRGIFTLYISTDYVFPGTLPHPSKDAKATCRTIDQTNPINGYGLTKLKGEEAMLEASVKTPLPNGAPSAAALRVPLLYGHVASAEDASRDGINILVEQIVKTATKSGVKSGDDIATLKVDDVVVKYPTWTGDVGRVCVDVCDEYVNATKDRASTFPSRLQFASQAPLTRYDMALRLCDILGFDQSPFEKMSVEETVKATPDSTIRIVPDRSAEKDCVAAAKRLVKDGSAGAGAGEKVPEEEILKSTARPVHIKLDVSELDRIGVSTQAVKFEDWWRRELKAYRR